ncbi:MAG: hypothetical protein AAGJ96_04010 [Pseudomonadota bacterium]
MQRRPRHPDTREELLLALKEIGFAWSVDIGWLFDALERRTETRP